MKWFFIIVRAIRDVFFGPDSHSAERYAWASLRDSRIRAFHAPAGETIDLGAPVSIIDNPKYHWWTFWRPKKIVVNANTHINCRCSIILIIEDEDGAK